jgi:hypothetical protein
LIEGVSLVTIQLWNLLFNKEIFFMSELTTKKRNKLKDTQFALEKQRKYPIEDKAHARAAKSRASQMKNKGKLSSAEKAKIDAKADKVIKGKKKK